MSRVSNTSPLNPGPSTGLRGSVGALRWRTALGTVLLGLVVGCAGSNSEPDTSAFESDRDRSPNSGDPRTSDPAAVNPTTPGAPVVEIRSPPMGIGMQDPSAAPSTAAPFVPEAQLTPCNQPGTRLVRRLNQAQFVRTLESIFEVSDPVLQEQVLTDLEPLGTPAGASWSRRSAARATRAMATRTSRTAGSRWTSRSKGLRAI
jgi:hypothetical protein